MSTPQPGARVFTLVSVVPETFGGMVTAALQRSSALAELGQHEVEVLSKSTEMGDPRARARWLQETGQLSPSVNIRNVWFDLKTLPDAELQRLPSQLDTLVPAELLASDGTPTVGRTGADGTVLQVDSYRDDGTIAVSDRQDADTPGRKGARLVTVFTREGRPVGQWRSLRRLYHAWADFVIGQEEAFLIIDSAPTGGVFYDYQRDNVTLIQVIHTHHLQQMRSDERGGLNPDVMQMLTHLDWFDGVAILTSAQNRALREQGILGNNSFVAPNMLVAPTGGGSAGHDRARGAIVTRLVPMKRLDHAVEAVARAADNGTDVVIDIYGEGSQAGVLTTLVDDLALGEHVRLRGHDPHAKNAFAEASFTLLTSRYEGQSLVLLEAMAAGCIPIAYDVEYGPGDIITNGVNGFLVPDGDTSAMAEAISALAAMPASDRDQMRREAIRRAGDFSPRSIIRLWLRELQRVAKKRSTTRKVPVTGLLMSVSLEREGVRIEAVVTGEAAREGKTVMLGWMGRKGEAYGRVEVSLSRFAGGYRVTGVIGADRFHNVARGAILDVYLDVIDGSTWSRTRLMGADVQVPGARNGIAPYITKGENLSIRLV